MTSKDGPDGSMTKAGDLVRLDYDLWAEMAGKSELIDTTHEEVAQNAGVGSVPGKSWGPQPHAIGGEAFPAGIESALLGLRVGDTVEREFAPGEAFGERDPNLIELFTMHEIERLPEMRREDAHLDLGTVLTINGRRGRVTTLTAARVRVDFNPPFAGRKVRAKFQVVEKIVDPAEQVRAIVDLQYGHGAEFHVEHREKTFTLKVPDRTKFDPYWVAAKARVVDRVRTQLRPESVRFVEEWVTPAEAKAEAKAEPKAEPKVEAKAEPKAEPKVESKAETPAKGSAEGTAAPAKGTAGKRAAASSADSPKTKSHPPSSD